MTNVRKKDSRGEGGASGSARSGMSSLSQLNEAIVACRLCPRLIKHCRIVAVEKRAAYRNDIYHGLPVPNLLSKDAVKLLIVGLAPGAHGANRTGRMFTGDRSGDFLFRAMFETGFANQAVAVSLNDGLQLIGAVITASAHCAPPGNKPTPEELARCTPFLERTFDLLPQARVVLCLGRLALDAVLRLYKSRGWIARQADYRFGHGTLFDSFTGEGKPPAILCSFHPSQQNTFTGRLTPKMLREVFEQAREQIQAGCT
ncbi:MAG: uracil-DNA glycosylase [Phycisphaeraceae bacterium]